MSAPITAEDLASFALPTELTLAPDGRTVAVTVQRLDLAANEKYSQILLSDTQSTDQCLRPLTAEGQHHRQPSWSPDGRWVAFVSDQVDGNQIWVIPAVGGTPRQVTSMRFGAARPAWSPDGRALLFLAELREGQLPAKTADEAKPDEREERERIVHVTRLVYRWDGSPIAEGRTQIWIIDIADWLGGAEHEVQGFPTPRQVTTGDFDHAGASWAPQSDWIAFVSDRADDRDANRTDDIWVTHRTTGETIRITDGRGEVSRPSWSPDGSQLAWYGMPFPPDHSITNTHLYVASRDEAGRWSTPRDLLQRQDLTVGSSFTTDLGTVELAPPLWAADGRGIFTTANERGTVPLWWFPVADGAAFRVTAGALQIGSIVVLAATRQVVAIVGQPDRSPEVARFALDSPSPAIAPDGFLTDLNPWLRDRAISLPERFEFFSEDSWWLEGWILWPPAANNSEHALKNWPVLLEVHGGPHGFFGPAFNARHQLFAGAGYAVVAINPRGSIGYGAIFAQASDRDWGGADFRDIMSGLEAALQRGRLDPTRLAVTGASYGGYMTNWIIGQTQRFKAAVTINSVSNLLSCFGTGDMDATLGIPENGGTPWERMGYYLERSPLTHAPAVTTPTRIIGAERDWRCPISQSEEWYTALKFLRRAEVDFLRVPGVSHNINSGSPRQRVAHRRAILEWIQRFVPAGPH